MDIFFIASLHFVPFPVTGTALVEERQVVEGVIRRAVWSEKGMGGVS